LNASINDMRWFAFDVGRNLIAGFKLPSFSKHQVQSN
jgi:hypothetical protein